MVSEASSDIDKLLLQMREQIDRYSAEIASERNKCDDLIHRLSPPRDEWEERTNRHYEAQIYQHFLERTHYLELERERLAMIIAGTEVARPTQWMVMGDHSNPEIAYRINEILGS